MVRSALARLLLRTEPGARIPTVGQLCRELRVGSGTVQGALQSLTSAGAIRLTAHGHRGTELISRNVSTLWKLSGNGPVECTMPLPMSAEFSGLATGLSALFEQAELPLNLSFRQGVERRFQVMESGRSDVVVGSVSALTPLANNGHRVLALRDYSFYAKDSVVVITRSDTEVDPHGRIPIDVKSKDHAMMTRAEFPDATLVDTPYMMIPELLALGNVDAAVWHQTTASPLLVATGIDLHPLKRLSSDQLRPLSRAGLLLADTDRGAQRLVEEIAVPELLERIQLEVIEHHRLPEF